MCAAIFIPNVDYNQHHYTLYETLGLCSLETRRLSRILCLVYKVYSGNSPSYLTSLLKTCNSTDALRSNGISIFKIPKLRSNMCLCISGKLSLEFIASTIKMASSQIAHK